MSSERYILDTPLPLSQDFKSLKEKGLAFIQDHVGNEWSNLNTSDPGVTILDQVCYALTELGYCNDFPLKDILTGFDEKLQIENQFYLPEDILTTSAVTSDDYRKYIIDGVDNVNNAIVQGGLKNYTYINRACQLFLLIDESVTGAGIDDVCRSAYYYLNKSRNLGQLFAKPKPLDSIVFYLNGNIEIGNENDLNKILVLINQEIRNYIFPEVFPSGYSKLVENGVATNDIFDGPFLQNGWIPTSSLGKKRNGLTALELVSVIGSIAGINSVSGLSFARNGNTYSNLVCGKDQILTIDVIDSFNQGCLQVQSNFTGKNPPTKLSLTSSLGKSPEFDPNIILGSAVDIHADLPKGKFRHINSYYSIQNTFPEIFATGLNSIVSNATEFQIAQSRQLKGYLTLFDQVLANQFSQLANIDRLFSFKNSMTGAPTDRHTFFERKDDYQKKHLEYPVPYLEFSPTYFYQSLYEIPHIQALLKNNETFNFSREIEPEKVLEENSWRKYKMDPYNPYIKGLMEFMENEKTSLERRNEMLDHLLARHGESPLLINAMVEGSIYSGESLSDKVIFKSQYLQNLGLLSYYRYKAYNYLSADRIAETVEGKVSVDLPAFTPDFEQRILGGEDVDFIFNSRRSNWVEKLTERDFNDYAALELKLCLLFGLKIRYINYIIENTDDIVIPNPESKIPITNIDPTINQALWFIEKRRGLIMVEMALLFRHFSFQIVLVNEMTGTCYQVGGTLDYDNATHVVCGMCSGKQQNLDAKVTKTRMKIGEMYYSLMNSEMIFDESVKPKKIPGTHYSLFINAICFSAESRYMEYSTFKNAQLFPSSNPKEQFNFRINLFDSTIGKNYVISNSLDYDDAANALALLFSSSEKALNTLIMDKTLEVGTNHYELENVPLRSIESVDYERIGDTLYFLVIEVTTVSEKSQELDYSIFRNGLEFLFPQFVQDFQQKEFSNRLSLFLENEIPLGIMHKHHLVKKKQLDSLIPAFIRWHESLIYKPGDVNENEIVKTAWELLTEINQIHVADKK